MTVLNCRLDRCRRTNFAGANLHTNFVSNEVFNRVIFYTKTDN